MAKVDFDKLLDKVMNLDEQIRYVGIYHNGVVSEKMRDNVERILTEEESLRSARQTVLRFVGRRSLSQKLGEPVYSVTKYEKITRITIPIGLEDLLFVSVNTEADHEKVIAEILKIKNDIISEIS